MLTFLKTRTKMQWGVASIWFGGLVALTALDALSPTELGLYIIMFCFAAWLGYLRAKEQP